MGESVVRHAANNLVMRAASLPEESKAIQPPWEHISCGRPALSDLSLH
jgi:hypothetical protein